MEPVKRVCKHTQGTSVPMWDAELRSAHMENVYCTLFVGHSAELQTARVSVTKTRSDHVRAARHYTRKPPRQRAQCYFASFLSRNPCVTVLRGLMCLALNMAMVILYPRFEIITAVTMEITASGM
jgi:hypothetical protein